MSSAEKKFEDQLEEAGNKLENPPSAVDELLSLLEVVENLVQKVEQSPGKSMQTALESAQKALVKPEFLRHEDVDVKVAVASCISEITRITAPDAPYDDNDMRDVFQLIVSSFDDLSDKSSRSYSRRVMILETVAKVRSCVVMLDLECDALIVEMFEHFFKAIRDDHPEAVFSSMETIMSLVLDESEEISSELLAPLLVNVKKDNEEVLPIARKLGEKVLEKCKTKLKPYLTQAVRSLGISFDDYSEVIASVCQGTADDVEQNGFSASAEQLGGQRKDNAPSEEAAQADENKFPAASTDEAEQVAKDSVPEEGCPEVADATDYESPKLVVSNGVTETGSEGPSKDHEASILPEPDRIASESVNVDVTIKAGNENAGKSAKSESKSEQSFMKRGNKPNCSINSTEPSESSQADGGEAEKLSDNQEDQSKDVQGSRGEDQSVEEAMPLENEKEIDVQHCSPKKLEVDALNASSLPSTSLPEESSLKKLGRTKDSVITEDTAFVDDVSNKASRKASDSDTKLQKCSGQQAAMDEGNKIAAATDTSKVDGGTTSDSEAKPLRQPGKKVEASNNIEEKSSIKDSGKRRARTKDASEKDVSKFSAKDDVKESVSSTKTSGKSSKAAAHLDETPKVDSKRKRTLASEKVSESVEYDENLVGTKVKVWWPKDKTYYEGLVTSFDPVKKKHKVSYNDGDEEILNLRREKWQIIGGASESDGGQATEDRSPDTSEMPRRKKSKTNSEPSAKQDKMEISPKRGHAASSKSGHKSDGKADGKSRDSTLKSGNKSRDDVLVKSKGRLQKSGKFVDDASKAGSKSKEGDGGTPKTPKGKSDSPKSSIKSKGKFHQTTNKNNANGTGKMKSVSKGKATSDLKEKSPDSGKKVESMKGKSTDTSKSRDSDSQSGKKRRRVRS